MPFLIVISIYVTSYVYSRINSYSSILIPKLRFSSDVKDRLGNCRREARSVSAFPFTHGAPPGDRARQAENKKHILLDESSHSVHDGWIFRVLRVIITLPSKNSHKIQKNFRSLFGTLIDQSRLSHSSQHTKHSCKTDIDTKEKKNSSQNCSKKLFRN